MAVTRLERKGKRNKSRAKNRVNRIKKLGTMPVIKNVDIEEIKKGFEKAPAKKAAPKKEKAEKEEAKAEAPKEVEAEAKKETAPKADKKKEETSKDEAPEAKADDKSAE